MVKASAKNNKLVILVVLLVLIFSGIGFLVGFRFGSQQKIEEAQLSFFYENENERRRELVKKCGDIPREKLRIDAGNFSKVDGSEWSPDCMKIAYSIFNSGTTITNKDGASGGVVGQAEEGVYVYSVDSGEISKLNLPDSAKLVTWEDNDLVVYTFLGTEVKLGTYSVGFNRILSDINRF